MCSRLWSGSASMPSRASRLVAAVSTRSRKRSASSTHLGRRRRERSEDRERPAGVAARREDRDLRGVAQAADALAVLAPRGEPLAPLLGLGRGELVARDPLARGVLLVDPGQEVLRAQLGEGQQQVGEVALGVDDHGRDAVDRGLLEQVDAEAGLAAAGHADDHGVRDQVARVVEQGLVARRERRRVERPAQVEDAELFEVHHRDPPQREAYRERTAARAVRARRAGRERRAAGSGSRRQIPRGARGPRAARRSRPAPGRRGRARASARRRRRAAPPPQPAA